MNYKKAFEELFELTEKYNNMKLKKENLFVRFIKRIFGIDQEKEMLNNFLFEISNIVYGHCVYIYKKDKFFASQESAELYCAENGIDMDEIE
jgi:hypothetical protein